ncbi:MAG: hypothetical protein LDL37_06775 [Asticcacaulis sp.]|uniref:hypothetical protein n=1 Tax=Asticcacaulis sp. TaxID=1872648 RepID=UPI0025BEB22E|nr:hypothetical protein [Asticcacaulis sp.]MCA1935138.1 hypothetical protein [Asticcacaulis sp.]
MPKHKGPILLDNNAIGDAVDLNKWKALVGAYKHQLHTVRTVSEEAGSYFAKLSKREELMVSLGNLSVHEVTDADRVGLHLAIPGVTLDAGERDLWAHARKRQDAWILCGPDKASVRAAIKLGLQDRLISLEELLTDAGISTKGLPDSQTKKWLDQAKNKILFSSI